MATALKMHLEARTAPVIAALAAVAAGTLIAATILGQSLGPIPIDNPAIALIPGSGADAPLILNIPSQSTLAPEPAGVLTAQLPAPVPAAAADELVPNRSRTGVLIVSAPPEPREHPAPNATLVEEIRERVSEITEPLFEQVESRGPAGRAIAAVKRPHETNDGNVGRAQTGEAVARTAEDVSAQAGSPAATDAIAEIVHEVAGVAEEPIPGYVGAQSKSGALSSGPQSKSALETAVKPEEPTESEV